MRKVTVRVGEGTSVGTEDAVALHRCVQDVEMLTRLSAESKGLDPTAIAERILKMLIGMLGLDLVGIQLNGALPMFRHVGPPLAQVHPEADIAAGIDAWLDVDRPSPPSGMAIGAEVLPAIGLPLGEMSSMGLLFAAARRDGFPEPMDALRLRVAAAQASLAMREAHELAAPPPSAETRPEQPADAALVASEWNLSLIINTIPAMAWSTTAEGILDFCNQHFLDFVGLSFEKLARLGFYRIFHPDDVQHLLSAWQEILASKRAREVEGRIRSASGTYRWFALRKNPLLDKDGNVVKWYGVVLDIEDRKCAEDALKSAQSALLASEQNLRLIIESLPVLVRVGRQDGSAEFLNQRWADYIGVDVERILEGSFTDRYHPGDGDRVVRKWRQAVDSGTAVTDQGRIRRYDGEYQWFYFAGQKITDAHGTVRWVGANVDIEDLRRAEDALKASEQRLKLIIDTIPAMAWSATPDGKVDFWNKSLLDFCGLSIEDIAGEGFYRIFHPDDVESIPCHWERICASKVGEEIDSRILRADGEYRWFNLRQNPLLDANGDVVKWYGALIEDRRRAEEELRQSQSDLARVSCVTTLGELAGSIAHEVNQLLMAVVTNAATCLRWLDDTQLDIVQARQAAGRVVREGHRAGDIIASIRAMVWKTPTHMATMDLRGAIRDVLLILNGEFHRRAVDARVDGEAREPLFILGDCMQLRQVLLNLIMNDVDAKDDNGSVPKRLIIRSSAGVDGFAQVNIQDTGSGLNQTDSGRIFEVFFSTKPGGMGMGLSICRSIMEAHRGAIMVAPLQDPPGSIFSFTVPMRRRPE